MIRHIDKKHFIGNTNKSGHELYILNHHTAPDVMEEIGRLREVSFTAAGGGTGKTLDIDDYDTCEKCYQQLIVYAPEDHEIIGGYRFIDCGTLSDELSRDEQAISTAHYFDFSDEFTKTYLPHTIELGRSWIQPSYQPAVNPRKGLFALDNLWDGIGAIVVQNPHIKYFFGKVTMYPNYNIEAIGALQYFMNHFFPDLKKLVTPKIPLFFDLSNNDFKESLQDLSFKEGHKVLQKFVRAQGEFIPPLINNYMQLSPSMLTFGTANNDDFGKVQETGILITIDDIYPEKKARHIQLFE
jgi:hypothetical protein